MPKIISGNVVSVGSSKTIIVRVDTRVTHPIYKKQYTKSKRIAVHDQEGKASVGDKVEISEIKPVSKTKRWTLVKITRQSAEVANK